MELYRISVYNRKTSKLIFQTMPVASLQLAQKQLFESNVGVIKETNIKSRKSVLRFLDNDNTMIIETINGAYTPIMEIVW